MDQWMGQTFHYPAWQIPIQGQHTFRDPGPCPLPQDLPCGFAPAKWTRIESYFSVIGIYMNISKSFCASRWEEVKQRGVTAVLSPLGWGTKGCDEVVCFFSCSLGVDRTACHLTASKPSDPWCPLRDKGEKNSLISCPAGACVARILTNSHPVFTHPPEAHTFWENCNHSVI